jgi:putative flippase GtrA
MSRPNVRQFLRYAVVGAAQNGTYLALFAIAGALGVPLVPATLIGAAAAITLSFALNRRWTFRGADDRTAGRAVRYVVVWLSFVVASIPVLVVLVEVLHVPRVAAQALIICVGAPISYLIQRHWTFRPRDLEDTDPTSAARAMGPLEVGLRGEPMLEEVHAGPHVRGERDHDDRLA